MKNSKLEIRKTKVEEEDSLTYSDRINRIRGQVNGIAKMLETDRACIDIVQQIAAAKSAITQLGIEILKNEALECSKDNDQERLNNIIEKLFKLG